MFQIYWHFCEKGRFPEEIDQMDAIGYMKVLAWRANSDDTTEDKYIDDVL